MSRLLRARLGFLAGVALMAVGLGVQLGIGWGLLIAGIGLAVWSVALYDVDEPESGGSPKPRGGMW